MIPKPVVDGAAARSRLTIRLTLGLVFAWLGLPLFAGLAGAQTAGEKTERVLVREPVVDIGVNFMASREQTQRKAAESFEVEHAFRFADRQPESGIDFVHESVDDSLKYWMPVHYDHGNGIVAADVDGDDLPDLYFLSQLGGNELWRNLGEGRFRNVTAEAGVGLEERIGVTAAFGDIDNDGDADLFVTTVRTGNALFENDGKGRFTDITEAAGLGYVGHSSGALFLDFDRDGLLDLFVTNVGKYTTDEKGRGGFYRGIDQAFEGHVFPERSERSLLYRNLGKNRFAEVASELGLEDTSWSGDASIVDFNRDLFPDLYVLNMQGDDHYYENRGGKRFAERTAEFFPKTSWGAMGLKFFDYNNDGRLDLFVTDMHSDMGDPVDPPFEKFKFMALVKDAENNLPGNAFYEQQADGSFTEVSDQIGAENYWPWGLSVGDLNADGWQDVFIASSMNYPFRYQVNSLLLNNRGRGFLDSEFVLGVEPRRGGRVDKPLFDLDCSGADKDHERCEGREGPITVVGTLGTRSSVILDLDRDGDLDIVTNEFNDVPQVFISDLAERRDLRYVEIELIGTRSNRDGLGAHVTLEAGPLKLTRYHDGTSGYLSHSSLPLYFGLGAADAIERIEVRWPSGETQIVTEGLGLNRRIEIREPAP